MNVAVIFAGGTGQRMKTSGKPKQFLELHGKPILVYTIEKFQQHEEIDGIIVVCVSSWIDYCKELLSQHHLTKVADVVAGGTTGQNSIYNGLAKAMELYPKDSIVLIHDGVRPLVDEKTITQAIETTKVHGSAITVSPAIETVTLANAQGEIDKVIERSRCLMAKAPQCFYLCDIYNAHTKAIKEKKEDFIDSASLMRYYGHKLYTVEGSFENIKITAPVDFYIFRAIVDARESLQIFGL